MLGVKIHQMRDGIRLDQQHVTEALLDQYGMNACKIVVTPLTPNEHIHPATTEEVTSFMNLKTNYRSAIGRINYLSSATRPDLSFAVSTLSQYLKTPGLKNWQAFLHVLKYLSGSRDQGLYYPRQTSKTITAFSDADWGNCNVICRSTTGYLTCFHQCLVFWKTHKQPSVSISPEEAEYKSLCDITSELLWFKQWCEEARVVKLESPICIYKDNQACIKTANGDCNLNNKHLKHVDIQLHFIKEVIKNKVVSLHYIPSAQMLADFLKKSVSKDMLERSLQSLSVL
ncbi:hypothetical protein O181_018171 [Austropuccinia psidii MF-1]|uniref:Reverse transcriptase Ty1/copia-type domain-containing protein n=1 Tax=Austropuccinia psidii MF-1 TaxID=1389203 RepID=A0A9Q3C4S3_9BASI|nr:hypothetical protein [Austropuccinia psidii MF-1]